MPFNFLKSPDTYTASLNPNSGPGYKGKSAKIKAGKKSPQKSQQQRQPVPLQKNKTTAEYKHLTFKFYFSLSKNIFPFGCNLLLTVVSMIISCFPNAQIKNITLTFLK